MTPQFRTFLKMLGAAALIYAAWSGLRYGCDRIEIMLDPCDLPCRPGHASVTGSCDPVSVELEVKTVPNPLGGPSTVWYRGTVRNRTCRKMEIGDLFLARDNPNRGDDLWKDSSHIEVVRMNGEAVSILSDPSRWEFGSDVSGIEPYATRNDEIAPLITSSIGSIRLYPSDEVRTNYEVLAPYREVMTDFSSPRGWGTKLVPMPVAIDHPERIYAVPPKGFRRLQSYDLRRPGRYKAWFEFRDRCFMTYHFRESEVWRNRLDMFAFIFAHRDDRGRATAKYLEDVDAVVRSAPVEFEVVDQPRRGAPSFR